MRACPYTCVLAHVCVREGMHARARVYVCVCVCARSRVSSCRSVCVCACVRAHMCV